MLLILRSSSAFSFSSTSLVLLRLFFSLGKSAARGWRCPTGAWIVGWLSEFFGTVEPCANTGLPVRTTSATDRIIFRILVLPFYFLSRAGTSIVAQLRRP